MSALHRSPHRDIRDVLLFVEFGVPGRGDDLTPPPMRLDEVATARLIEVAGRYGTTFPPLLQATPRRRHLAARGTAGPGSRASTPRWTTRGDQPRRAVADPGNQM
jgi:hypothetical protein